MNESALIFKPTDVTIVLDGTEYRLTYDLNAFCELEKIYDSVDGVLQMLLGTSAVPDMDKVTYQGKPVLASDVLIDNTPLITYINKINKVKAAKHTDTLNLLWIGVLHDYSEYDAFGEIKCYTISKAKLGAAVNFKNLREVNSKILTAILRDLLPSDEVKNAEAPEVVEAVQKVTLIK